MSRNYNGKLIKRTIDNKVDWVIRYEESIKEFKSTNAPKGTLGNYRPVYRNEDKEISVREEQYSLCDFIYEAYQKVKFEIILKEDPDIVDTVIELADIIQAENKENIINIEDKKIVKTNIKENIWEVLSKGFQTPEEARKFIFDNINKLDPRKIIESMPEFKKNYVMSEQCTTILDKVLEYKSPSYWFNYHKERLGFDGTLESAKGLSELTARSYKKQYDETK